MRKSKFDYLKQFHDKLEKPKNIKPKKEKSEQKNFVNDNASDVWNSLLARVSVLNIILVIYFLMTLIKKIILMKKEPDNLPPLEDDEEKLHSVPSATLRWKRIKNLSPKQTINQASNIISTNKTWEKFKKTKSDE